MGNGVAFVAVMQSNLFIFRFVFGHARLCSAHSGWCSTASKLAKPWFKWKGGQGVVTREGSWL